MGEPRLYEVRLCPPEDYRLWGWAYNAQDVEFVFPGASVRDISHEIPYISPELDPINFDLIVMRGACN